MNKSPFFTIIVPIYNCEKYLGECIESVIAQSFDDWELLLVDDGSSDLSGEICDRFSEKDGRITVVHKANGGEFSARKAGLDIATGCYITGLDADDYYEKDHLKDIYRAIQEHQVDCVSFSIQYTGSREGITDTVVPGGKIITGEEFLLTCIRRSAMSFCDKAIKSECYKSVDYNDAPPIRFSEDEIMVIPALCNVNNVCGVSIASYRYRIHDESACAKHDFRHIEYLDEAMNYNLRKIREYGLLTEQLEREYKKFFLHSLNVRVWDLFLANQWEAEMKNRVKNLSIFSSHIPKDLFADYDLKERIRIESIVDGRYWFLKFAASVYRKMGKGISQ